MVLEAFRGCCFGIKEKENPEQQQQQKCFSLLICLTVLLSHPFIIHKALVCQFGALKGLYPAWVYSTFLLWFVFICVYVRLHWLRRSVHGRDC